MRIDNTLPFFNFETLQAAAGDANRVYAPAQPQNMSYHGQGVIVEISQQARDAYNKSIASADLNEKKGISEIGEIKECQTCKNRKYVDVSNDPSVSYQTPANISPEQAAGKVMAHEREHVTNEQARAQREDRRVVSQTVTLSSSICPECGRIYISGGVTRTVTVNDNKNDSMDAKKTEL